jgi:hypothetical protein
VIWKKTLMLSKQSIIGLIGEAGKRASAILRLQKATEDAYNFNKKQYASVAKNAMTTMQQFESAAKEWV